MTALIFFINRGNASRFQREARRYGYEVRLRKECVEIEDVDEDDLTVLKRDIAIISHRISASPHSMNF